MTSSSLPAPGTTVPRIFVSHSHKDNAFCRPFVAHLRAALGLADPDHIFYDESSLHYGDDWLDRIQREVLARPIFLVILKPNSVEADYVRTETGLALRETIAHKDTRLLISLLAEECDPNRLAPLLLGYQMADFVHKRYDVAFDELVAYLRTRRAGELHDAADAPSQYTGDTFAPPADPNAALVARLVPGIREAYKRREWHVVVDKVDYLIGEASAATPTEVYRMLGEARFETGDFAASLAALESVLARESTDIPALALAARACLRTGNFTNAVTYLKRALALVDSAADRLALLPDYAEALTSTSQWDELLRRCDEALRLQPDDVAWQRRRLTALQIFHRDTEALAALRTITASANATAGDWIARARLAYTVANNTTTDEVRTALDAAARLAPAHDPALAAARKELLPPPPPPPPQRVRLPADRLPAKLIEVDFTAYEQEGVAFILPPLCDVPAGPFMMGSDPRRDQEAQPEEQPAHEVTVPAFQIARYPVTVAEYACFVRAGHAEPQPGYLGTDWRTQLARLDHPVTCVDWQDAIAYAAWLAEWTGQPIRLPTEAEWEKAARWDASWDAAHGVARLYPWGDSFDKARCNTDESGHGTTTPVYAYPNGASPCGAQDMAGNVWEWTSSLFKPYPYSQSDGREDPNSTDNRVLRGGSWYYVAGNARAAGRVRNRPAYFGGAYGFRLAVASVRAGSRDDS